MKQWPIEKRLDHFYSFRFEENVADELYDSGHYAIAALKEILQECHHSDTCEWLYYKLGAKTVLKKTYLEWAQDCTTVDCPVGIARRALEDQNETSD